VRYYSVTPYILNNSRIPGFGLSENKKVKHQNQSLYLNAKDLVVDKFNVEPLKLRGTFQGKGKDNETYILSQLGEELQWYLENNTDTQNKHFQGAITGNKISGSWSVLLNGSTQSGNRVVEIVTPNHLKAIGETGAFGDIEWTRLSTEFPQCETILNEITLKGTFKNPDNPL
jgi:hypothetical protein